MTYIQKLNLFQVRSHDNSSFVFDNYMNAIVGPNGSGKTTVIESLFTLLTGSSFKGPVREMLQKGKSNFATNLEVFSDTISHGRSLQYIESDGVNQKKWAVDNKKHARLPIGARLPVVLFEPELGRLISGSPSRRRSYIDGISAQLDPETARAQLSYDRIVKQRNQLLKQLRLKSGVKSTEQLFVWDTQLAHMSEIIIKSRIHILERLQSDISKYYSKLGGTDEISMRYNSVTSTSQSDYASKLLSQLQDNIKLDIQLGYTSVGPHRDDILVYLNSQPAIERASRGEIRTIVIAMKLLETSIISDFSSQRGISPTLLLDDVLSELDLLHQEKVLDGLKDHQVFITTTDAHVLSPGVHTIFLE